MNDSNPDVSWTVNGIKYGRKIDALIASKSRNSHITFNYYNDIFKEYNWEVEPSESFAVLAGRRAQQLRDTSKYLRLWYSGGADSHTMLQAFLSNSIHIDEIVMVRTSPSNDFDAEYNRETNLRSIPYIRSIQHIIPKTKISIVDVTAEQYLNLYKTDWHLQTTSYDFSDDPGILLGSRQGIEQYTNLRMHTDIVEITGGDKPKVIKVAGIYYAPITDSQFSYLYWAHCKEFFTTPEMPELHCKQSHMMIRILEEQYPAQDDISHTIYNQQYMDPKFKKLWYNCARTIINYDVDFGKGWSLVSPKCQLRVQDAKANNPELWKYYLGTLQELQPHVSHYWQKFDEGAPGVLAGVYSLGSGKKI